MKYITCITAAEALRDDVIQIQQRVQRILSPDQIRTDEIQDAIVHLQRARAAFERAWTGAGN